MNEGLQMLRGVGVFWPELLGAAVVDFHLLQVEKNLVAGEPGLDELKGQLLIERGGGILQPEKNNLSM